MLLRLTVLAAVGYACAMSDSVQVWDHYDVVLKGPAATSSFNPFLSVSLNATFSDGQQQKTTVVGFYRGGDEYVVRFMPETSGDWSYVTGSNEPALSGLKGSFVAAPASSSSSPLSQASASSSPNHGVARTLHDGLGFAYDDGTPYVPVGTTSYAWLHQPQGEVLENVTLESLRKSPFNKLRMTIFPKYYPYTHDEPRWYPFQGKGGCSWSPGGNCSWDFSRFDPSFWQHVEERVGQMRDMGVVAEIILFHPYGK